MLDGFRGVRWGGIPLAVPRPPPHTQPMPDDTIAIHGDKERGRHLAVIIDASLDAFRNKTAIALLRFCPHDVVCVIDPRHAGMDLDRLLGVGVGIPVVASALDAVKLGARHLVIGVATPGGYLPPELRPMVYEAIRNRVGIISGLHESVGGDPNLTSLAARHAVELINLRTVSDEEHVIGTGLARGSKAYRVLTVGTDASIGKTTTTLLIERALRLRKVRSRFVATGQDGILIKGRGLCIDRCITDFASGAAERLVLREAKGADLLLIEGQDALLSPCYSAVSLALLHGSCPDAMVLCHQPSRGNHRHTDVPIPPLAQYRAAYEAMLAPLHPGKVVAISLNTMDMDEAAARKVIAKASAETGLPAADPVREGEAGCERLAEAILAAAHRSGHPSARAAKTALRGSRAPARATPAGANARRATVRRHR
jgi:uncharacterized NAD-dependent epimerase/dehydratase family protein